MVDYRLNNPAFREAHKVVSSTWKQIKKVHGTVATCRVAAAAGNKSAAELLARYEDAREKRRLTMHSATTGTSPKRTPVAKAASKNIYSEVLTIPRDEHMDFRVEVQVREEDKKLSGVLIAGKARDGWRVLDVYVKGLTAQQMIELSRRLTEAAGIISAREA